MAISRRPAATRDFSGLDEVSTPQIFYTCFCDHARRLRLEKPLHLGTFLEARSAADVFLNASGSRWPFQKRNGLLRSRFRSETFTIHNGYVQKFHFPNKKVLVRRSGVV
jgi:hypothetical protein